MPVHDAAQAGFGSTAGIYETARPGYPPDAVEWLFERLRIEKGSTVVDLGAGTGKLTRHMLGRGATVIAIEPIERMRALLIETSPTALPVGGDAERLPLRSGSVDALTMAQAFHWVDTSATHGELARVIRPGGRLGLIWNARLRNTAWLDAFWSIMDRAEKKAPWRDHQRKSEADRQLPGFSPFQQAEFFHDHTVTPLLLVQRLASVSHVAARPPDDRQAILDEAAHLLATNPSTKGQELLTVRYRVDCFVAIRN